MNVPTPKVSCSLKQLLENQQTMTLISSALTEKLKEEFGNVSIAAIHASIQTTVPDICEQIIKETDSWEPTRSNYEEAVKSIAKRALTATQKLLMHIEPEQQQFVQARNIGIKEKSVDESY